MNRKTLERVERCVHSLQDTRKVAWEDRERYLVELQGHFQQLAPDQTVSPELLMSLRRPLEAQVRDLRSAIVREACGLVTVLTERLGAQFGKTAMCLVPALLDLHASGNKVITGYVVKCTCCMFEQLRMPPALQRLLQLLKESKSKDIREASMTYLQIVLEQWSARTMSKHFHLLEEVMLRVLQDASPTVRKRARDCFIAFAGHFPDSGRTILRRVDERTQRALIKAMENKLQRDKAQAQQAQVQEQSQEPASQQKQQQQQQQQQIPSAPKPTRIRRPSQSELPDAVIAEASVPPLPPTASSKSPATEAPVENEVEEVRHEDGDLNGGLQVNGDPNVDLNGEQGQEDEVTKQGSLEELVLAHRIHLNEIIEDLSHELADLKAHEGLASRAPSTDPASYALKLRALAASKSRRSQELMEYLDSQYPTL